MTPEEMYAKLTAVMQALDDIDSNPNWSPYFKARSELFSEDIKGVMDFVWRELDETKRKMIKID